MQAIQHFLCETRVRVSNPWVLAAPFAASLASSSFLACEIRADIRTPGAGVPAGTFTGTRERRSGPCERHPSSYPLPATIPSTDSACDCSRGKASHCGTGQRRRTRSLGEARRSFPRLQGGVTTHRLSTHKSCSRVNNFAVCNSNSPRATRQRGTTNTATAQEAK